MDHFLPYFGKALPLRKHGLHVMNSLHSLHGWRGSHLAPSSWGSGLGGSATKALPFLLPTPPTVVIATFEGVLSTL